MRIGIFGGTFNPVHFGHLMLAESCREQCKLDQVWFVPSSRSPHKRDQPVAADRDRVTMLELAIAGHEGFRVSTLELDRGGISYTVDTLEEIRRQQPDDELAFLMGADSLRDFPSWREPRRICELAVPVVVVRNGAPSPDLSAFATLVTSERLEQIHRFQVNMPVVEFSSSDIRDRAATGRSIRYRTPRAVEQYICHHQLYSHSETENRPRE